MNHLRNLTAIDFATLLGLKLSRAQSAYLKVYSSKPLDWRDKRALAKIGIKDPTKLNPDKVLFWIILAGRRSGKSQILIACCILQALFTDVSDLNLVPGERSRIWLLGAVLKHSRTIVDAVSGMLTQLGIKHDCLVNGTIDVPGLNPLIEIRTASEESVIGATVLLACVDEFQAFPHAEGSSNQDRRVIGKLVPALATLRPHSRVIIAGTAGASSGYFYELCETSPSRLLQKLR